MKDKYDEFCANFKNEAELEEELDEEGLNFEDIESEHYFEDEFFE